MSQTLSFQSAGEGSGAWEGFRSEAVGPRRFFNLAGSPGIKSSLCMVPNIEISRKLFLLDIFLARSFRTNLSGSGARSSTAA